MTAAVEDRLGRIEQELGALLRHGALPAALNDPHAVLLEAASITSAYIANAAIQTAHIGDAQITSAKVASLDADKLVAGSGIINNLTINATLTIGAGGKIVDADGSEWTQNVLRLVSAGAEGDAFVLKVGAVDRAYISADSSDNAIFGLHSAGATNPTSLLLRDGDLILGFEGLGFNTLRPRVIVDTSGVALGNVAPSWGGASVAVFIGQALTNPSSNPVGGFLLFCDASTAALRGRGSSGTVTTIAAAEPHCPDCGRDFALEWENDEFGYLALCMWCLTDGAHRGVIARRAA